MAENEIQLVSADNQEFTIVGKNFSMSSSTIKGNILIMVDDPDEGPSIYEVNERYFHSKVPLW